MKIGLSTCGKPFCMELFKQYADNKIECMELSYDKKQTDVLDLKAARKYADEYGIELWSMHLPFMPFKDIDISNPNLCDKTVDYYEKLIKKAVNDASIKRFIVHPSGEPISDGERQERFDTAKEKLQILADRVKPLCAVICVENLPRTCLGKNSDEIIDLVSSRDNLRVCFDTNHLLGEDFVRFLKNVGGLVESIHVSDYDFIDEKHWLPGEGNVDWNKLYAELLNTGYDGVWLYEVGFDLQDTRPERTRKLTCADFYTNATEIFAGMMPTVIR